MSVMFITYAIAHLYAGNAVFGGSDYGPFDGKSASVVQTRNKAGPFGFRLLSP